MTEDTQSAAPGAAEQAMVLAKPQMEIHWQHMAALILWKCKGRVRLQISKKDIERFTKEFAPGMPCIYHRSGRAAAIEFQVVSEAAGAQMVADDAKGARK